jgi:hypothetical protein
MYQIVAKETISEFMNGYNATIFAYGQSGSGKTFSMVGPDEINDQLANDFTAISTGIQELFGTIPRAVLQIFQTINELVLEGYECQVTCSYVEIYMEEITCLLSLKDKLKIKEFADSGIEVDGKKKVVCKTPEDIFKVIAMGTKNKSIGGTLQNERSSRSHTLLIIELNTKSVDGQEKKSKLNLVDLAGSEKTRNTGATGDRAKEAIKINLSLTSLNMVFMALTTPGENRYVPFKDSKLTRLLKDSLGGNSLTTLLCTASRKVRYTEDTIGTLGFAQRAKKIKNKVTQNVMMGVKEYRYLADAMKAEIMILRGDLQKAGLPIHLISDKKVLLFVPNEAINTDEQQHESIGVNDDNKGRRGSLTGLSSDQIVMKYIELRARYDNLFESAGRKISELTYRPEIMFTDTTKDDDERINKILSEKDAQIGEINQKHQAECDDYKKTIEELERKLQTATKEKIEIALDRERLLSEGESTQDMLNLNFNDITNLSDKLKKVSKKKSYCKQKSIKQEAEINDFSQRINEMYQKVSQSEYANSVYEAKIADLNRIIANHLETIQETVEKLNELKVLEEGLAKENDDIRTKLAAKKEQSMELK